jgi:hypothetical protein
MYKNKMVQVLKERKKKITVETMRLTTTPTSNKTNKSSNQTNNLRKISYKMIK